MSELGERYERESADPNSREVLEWAKEPGRRGLSGGLGGMNAIVGPKLVELVQNLYDLSAVRVTVARIQVYPEDQDAGRLYIELPDEPAKRTKLFAWSADFHGKQGFDPTPDEGQRYLLVMPK